MCLCGRCESEDTHNKKSCPTVRHQTVDIHEISLQKTKYQLYTVNIYRDINVCRFLSLINFLSVCKQGQD